MTDHLHPRAADLIERPLAERVTDYWDKIWVNYPRAEELLEQMTELRDSPARLRPRNLLVCGAPGNGKSGLLRAFTKQNPPFESPDHDYLQFPVLRIEAPSQPEEGRFWSQILGAMNLSHRVNESPARKEDLALRGMREAGVKVLVIDEIHSILTGPYNKQRMFMTLIKRTSNVMGIPIVAAGTDAADTVIKYEPQLASRFQQEELPFWELNRDFVELLDTFECLIPLRHPSGLTKRDMSNDLHIMCRGVLGNLSEILYYATIAAIKDKSERITRDTLKKIKWKPGGSKK